MEESGITNTLTSNVISGEGSFGPDDGVYINNFITSYVTGDNPDTASWISDVSIVNDFTDNEISDFGDDGVYLYNYIRSGTSDVENASIINTATGNTIANNGGEGFAIDNTISADDDVDASTESTSFSGNVIQRVQ